MQVTETVNESLSRSYSIRVPAAELSALLEARIAEIEEKSGRAPEDEGKSEEALQGEYRRIAERRVRLGLVLAEIGRRENIVVSDQELNEAMRAEARRYGDMAQQMFDYLRNTPQAQAAMRAPIYEEKVVDLILAKAKLADKTVSKEKLLEEDELPEGIVEAAPKKKAAAKAEASPKPAKATAPKSVKTGAGTKAKSKTTKLES
jgi:trigger factor